MTHAEQLMRLLRTSCSRWYCIYRNRIDMYDGAEGAIVFPDEILPRTEPIYLAEWNGNHERAVFTITKINLRDSKNYFYGSVNGVGSNIETPEDWYKIEDQSGELDFKECRPFRHQPLFYTRQAAVRFLADKADN